MRVARGPRRCLRLPQELEWWCCVCERRCAEYCCLAAFLIGAGVLIISDRIGWILLLAHQWACPWSFELPLCVPYRANGRSIGVV